MHHGKYIHFLFGQVEVTRGARIQRMYFLLPESIRVMKDHQLVRMWQDDLCLTVDRSSPEAKLDDFSDKVRQQYIPFVEHMYLLAESPFPLNMAGEMMAYCMQVKAYVTWIINIWVILIYGGTYDQPGAPSNIWQSHYPMGYAIWPVTHIQAIKFFGLIQVIAYFLYTAFSLIANSPIKYSVGIDEWSEENPRDVALLQNPAYKAYMAVYFCVLSDGMLMYNFLMTFFSYSGLSRNFLFFSFCTFDVLKENKQLQKVVEAVTKSGGELVGTMFLGMCIQYLFLAIGTLS